MTVCAYIVCDGKDGVIDQLEKLGDFGYEEEIIVNPGPLDSEKIHEKMAPKDIFVATSVMLLGADMKALYIFLSQLLAEEKEFLFIDEELDSRTDRGMQFMDDLEMVYKMERYIAHGFRQGNVICSRQPGRPKISDEQARRILDLYQNTNYTIREIASAVGVSIGTVHKYVKNSHLGLLMGRDRE